MQGSVGSRFADLISFQEGAAVGFSVVCQLLINGILAGALYAAIAVGLSLVFGIMKVINFAHGTFLMIAMYLGFWIWKGLGWEPYFSMVLTIPALFMLGYLIEGYIIEPVFKKEHADVREPIGVLLLTCGLGLALNNTALLLFTGTQRNLEIPLSVMALEIGDVVISIPRLIAFVGAALMVVLLYLFLTRTMIGKAMNATSQDREAARLIGIDDYKLYRLAFALNTSMVGIAGALLLPFFFVFPEVGELFNLKSFIVVVLGGVGSIPGVILGGLVVGLIESFGTHFLSALGAEVFIFAIFISLLLIRPKGLLGKE
jgi:branched-chain amino acid transport system permease protein